MSIGHPDYGQSSPTRVIAPVSDLGELAVRLGSIAAFNRAGNVLLLDDFEDGIVGWGTELTGAGSSVAVDTAAAYRGAKSVLLTANNGAAIGIAGINKFIVAPEIKSVGMEYTFAFGTEYSSLSIYLLADNGAQRQTFEFRLNYGTGTVQVFNVSAYATVGTLALFSNDSNHYHTIKVVCDPENGAYVRAMIDFLDFDLRNYAPQVVSLVGMYAQQTRFLFRSRSGQTDTCRVDNFIYTINEP